jgi:hypothetical protein
MQKLMIKEVTGYDELLLDKISAYPLPQRTSALLERILSFHSNFGEVDTEYQAKIARSLTQGDRVALILNARRIIFGDKISCVITCPMCKEAMSFDLFISKLLQPAISDPQIEYTLQIDDYLLKIRPITGGDLESLFELKNKNTTSRGGSDREYYGSNRSTNPAEKLITSVITFSQPPLPDFLPDKFIEIISSRLEEIDPQALTELKLECPGCRHMFMTQFNAEDFMLDEINHRAKLLHEEVHYIAFNYHWTEASILSLPHSTRKKYVRLIERTLSGGDMQ